MQVLPKNWWWNSLFLFIGNIQISYAQLSLINDGSFEDTTAHWHLNGGDGALKDWSTFKNDSSSALNAWAYFSTVRGNECSCQLPDNFYVRQYPRSGLGAIYLVNFIDSFQLAYQFYDQSVVRSKLKQKLVAGKQYCAKIYTTADEREGFYFTNGLGLYFDNGQLDTLVLKHKDSSGNYTIATPQLQCNFIINDTINWMKLEGSFVANGTEEYITIGNFVPDSILQKVVCGGGNPIPNFSELQNILIDDVSLIPLDIKNWLQDVYVSDTATSIWVGLDCVITKMANGIICKVH